MTKDYYATLGVGKDATDDEIKKAYRKLASKHHPDKGGTKEKFQEIQEAFSALETPEKRAAYDNPRPQQNFHARNPQEMQDEILRAMRAAHEHHQRNAVPFIRLNISIERAFSGTTVALNLFGHSIAYRVKPGLPQGVAYVDEVPVEDRQRQIQIQVNIDSGKFRFLHIGSEDGLNFSGDLETDIEVDALDIMAGGFIIAQDFLGKKLQVRVPSGFDPKLRLKIAGHGYTNWHGDKPGPRGDLYLRVTPRFKPFAELDKDKIEALYNLTRTPPIERTA
jgi:DnaJ-class molecular chaperone